MQTILISSIYYCSIYEYFELAFIFICRFNFILACFINVSFLVLVNLITFVILVL